MSETFPEDPMLDLNRHFDVKFGHQCQFVVKVPGRVNLIGEHIDYCGYSVCPMALEKTTLVAVSARPDSKIILSNTDEVYPDYLTAMDQIKIVKGEPHWHSYFLCGVQGVLDRINNEASGHATKSELLGMDCLVSSSVPVSAGLSSSSALVCAAAIALAHTNSEILVSKLSLNGHRTVFADLCARSERYIGTEGGGMDQAIALLATPGKAKLIDFNPLVTHDMQLPVDATFVVANSLVKANKAASFTFNHRVIECRLAAKILAITHNIDPTTISKLIDIQRALNQSLDEIIITTKSTLHELVYSKSEVAVLLQLSEEELNKSVLLSEHNASPEFYLRQRALHVFEEASRVKKFQSVCEDNSIDNNIGKLIELGNLMNESHTSCRDLYDCSHPQLDRLVELAQHGPGCYGARLTGAGWGGCIVALVKNDQTETFLNYINEHYYRDTSLFPTPLSTAELQAAAFVTRPGAGACILTPI